MLAFVTVEHKYLSRSWLEPDLDPDCHEVVLLKSSPSLNLTLIHDLFVYGCVLERIPSLSNHHASHEMHIREGDSWCYCILTVRPFNKYSTFGWSCAGGALCISYDCICRRSLVVSAPLLVKISLHSREVTVLCSGRTIHLLYVMEFV